jgi:hypothetical protein
MRTLMERYLVMLVLSVVVVPARAQWSTDSTVNNPICVAAGGQFRPVIISDGAGGAIIAWEDSRSGTSDIYAQRISAGGVVLWQANGVPICTASDDQFFPALVSDDSGGAIITWQDYRNLSIPDIYAQRVDAGGTTRWTTNGVPVCTAADEQFRPVIVTDGAGGAIIVWEDFRNGPQFDIYAQRVNAAGSVQWTADGVAISTADNDQRAPTIVADGTGGAIITWEDSRGSGIPDIYAQRINAAGSVQWAANGVPVAIAPLNQNTPTITSDGAGGAIITWWDVRGGSASDIYAQRLNANGAAQWTANGVAICTAPSSQLVPSIVSDGAGGAIITWWDQRNSTQYDIYAQRVNAAGLVQWTTDGVPISTAPGDQYVTSLVQDDSGGAIITWQDGRRIANDDIRAQRVNSTGVVQWTPDGAAISTASGSQNRPVITTDGRGGAIIAWQDLRGTTADIYAQQVNSRGLLGQITAVEEKGETPMRFVLEQNYPNPFNPTTTIKLSVESASGRTGDPARATLKVYDVLGREVATLVNENLQPGTYEVQWDATHQASGLYFYQLKADGFLATKRMVLVK